MIHIKNIVFIDTEISSSGKIFDIGAIKEKGDSFHGGNLSQFSAFLKKCYYIVGHNIVKYDSQYIHNYLPKKDYVLIDTLYLSPLLFPQRPYHKLVKDDKLISTQLNNPYNDSVKCRDLFYEEVEAFNKLPNKLRIIYYTLLSELKEFKGFFDYCPSGRTKFLANDIREYFGDLICQSARIEKMCVDNPIELAYALAIILVNDKESITPGWVHINYPKVESVIHQLRGVPCGRCRYCTTKFDLKSQLMSIFNYPDFRTYGGEPLQEKAVRAAVTGESILVVFPTGGGKSLTFQLPALIAGDAEKALTVVISPLQSLMKDQVENLEYKSIIDAVTINGMLDPIERKNALDKLYDGKATILYIAPESLRSKTIERALLKRTISRFVIDEAHCFSSWGHDFRVDYLYIANFIKNICEKKGMDSIPVSCFTATAKQKVISDISDYFKTKLNINLKLYATSEKRKNLHYKVIHKNNSEEKYQELRNIILEKNVPTIVFVSTTKMTIDLADRLNKDGITALPYHGKMDRAIKSANQTEFKNDSVQVMVATSAFGMGVDKNNVGLVIHYEISNSLENYVQEAGRAGRDEKIEADCYVLFSEDDLDKHFMMLNQTKLNMNEIQQIWQGIKNLTKTRTTVSLTALELARMAGWDDQIADIETRVRTAVSALENAGYVERGMNSPHLFATGVLVNSVDEARKLIENSPMFNEDEIEDSVRIISSIISSKNKSPLIGEEAESRLDYISDRLGIAKKRVFDIVNKFREEKILADSNDMIATISKGDTKTKSTHILDKFIKLERFILENLEEKNNVLNLKELNNKAIKDNISDSTIRNIKTIFAYWTSSDYIEKNIEKRDNYFVVNLLLSKEEILEKIDKRAAVSDFTLSYLFNSLEKERNTVEFSLLDLKNKYKYSNIFSQEENVSNKEIEDALLYLSKIHAIALEGGVLVIYNALQIKRLETNNAIKYKKEDYKKLDEFYKLKIQQIHIVGEYANMMLRNYKEAQEFVNDYFNLEYDGFIKKYFKGNKLEEIQKNITPAKYNKLFSNLSEKQKQIIDSESQYITVIAGPGSGKTRVLVHKLASLLLLEDIKTDQLLMLTFSRAAVNEFKKRLIELIGTPAYYVDIKTFHSYCFDLLGTIGEEDELDNVIPKVIELIENDEVEINKISKSVIVIDEAQDMDETEYKLIETIMSKNDDIRVIAVGDDDQNIYEFRGSSSKYLADFSKNYNAQNFELLENYRSTKRIIDFANAFAKTISNRMKKNAVRFVRKELGIMEIIEHSSENIEIPMVEHYLKSEKKGNVAFLTEKNEDALKVLGLLLKNGIQARLIQSNDGFKLINLIEVRQLLKYLENHTVILKEDWKEAKEKIFNKYKNSSNLETIKLIISTYEDISNEYYLTDFKEYLDESNLDDFVEYGKNKVIVSTIHKAKGKEFDSVYVMLKNPLMINDKEKRKMYVGFTRAINNLYVHINGNKFNKFSFVNGLDYKFDKNNYNVPEDLSIQLSHKDVVLSFFKSKKKQIFELIPGMDLNIDDNCLIDSNGFKYVKFSNRFIEKYNEILNLGYEFVGAKIRFIVAWFCIEDEQEYPIILPDLYFRYNNGDSPVSIEVIDEYKFDKEKIYNELVEYRKSKAKELKLLPYYIYNNRTLENIIEMCPTSIEELLEVDGIGSVKAKEYGDDIINIITKNKVKY